MVWRARFEPLHSRKDFEDVATKGVFCCYRMSDMNVVRFDRGTLAAFQRNIRCSTGELLLRTVGCA
jgi:hypothetical protein